MENFNNYSSGFDSEYSNADNITTDNITITTELDTETDEVFDDDSGNGTILFIFTAVGIGALVRHLLKHTPFPYTVILMILGLVIGFLVQIPTLSSLANYTAIADLEPHLFLLIFLPILIFESAFIVDIHIFQKTLAQSLVLAGPGVLFSTFFTALIARFVFNYNWSWVTSLMFGAMLSATDPVSVVALFKEQGTSDQLGTLIEGESLLNDGIAFVLFNVLLSELIPGQERSGLEIVIYLIQVALGGPLFGYVMARISILWLSYVYNDAVVEITITLASTYITYYIGEVFLKVSGVLAVVTLGIEMNKRRTNISPQVDVFLHKFWNMLSYLVNTLIFTVVGLVIAIRAFSGVEDTDWLYLVALYFGISAIRLVMVFGLSPILINIGYDINRKGLLVIVWGGLRGAVSLSLALVVVQSQGILDRSTGSKVLFHTAGIVLLTLLVNGTTLSYLLKCLGLSEISHARRLTLLTAIRHIADTKIKAITILKSDKFLVDADWGIVSERTVIALPLDNFEDEDMDLSKLAGVPTSLLLGSRCKACNAEVPRVLHPKEIAELLEDMRVKIIRAEKTSYWKQYNDGILDQEAVLILNNIADDVMDIPDKLVQIKDLEYYWMIPKNLALLRRWMGKMLDYKVNVTPPPKYNFNKIAYRLACRPLLDWIIFFVLGIDILLTSIELSISNIDTIGVLRICNFVVVGIYMAEVILKLIGLRLYFFKGLWNLFDVFLLVISWIDIYLGLSTTANTNITLSAIRIPRILRVLRTLKLVKIVMPQLIKLLDNYISHYLGFGYGVGKGFVLAEEDVLKQFDNLQFIVNESIGLVMKTRVEKSRLDVLRSLYLMQRQFPQVAITVKTHQAIHVVLNHCIDSIKQLKDGGVIDEIDTVKLLQPIEIKMKRLQRWHKSILKPTNLTALFLSHPWLSGLDEHILTAILYVANFIEREPGDILLKYNIWVENLIVVVSGLVKVTTFRVLEDNYENLPSSPHITRSLIDLANYSSIQPPWEHQTSIPLTPQTPPVIVPDHVSLISTLEATTHGDGETDFNKLEIEYVELTGVGTVLGEAEILEKRRTHSLVTCETGVEAFQLDHSELKDLMQEYPVLEERLWRLRGVSVATTLLEETVEYKDMPSNQLLLILYQNAIMIPKPKGPHPHLEILDDWKQVVVVSGEATCTETQQTFTAPCIVPNRVRSLKMTGDTKILVVCATNKLEVDNVIPFLQQRKKFNFLSKEWLLRFKSFLWLALMKLWLTLTYLYGQLCQNSLTVSQYSPYGEDRKNEFTYTYKHDISHQPSDALEEEHKSINPNLLSLPPPTPPAHQIAHLSSSLPNISDEFQTISSTSSNSFIGGSNIDILQRRLHYPVISTIAFSPSAATVTGVIDASTSASAGTGASTTTSTTTTGAFTITNTAANISFPKANSTFTTAAAIYKSGRDNQRKMYPSSSSNDNEVPVTPPTPIGANLATTSYISKDNLIVAESSQLIVDKDSVLLIDSFGQISSSACTISDDENLSKATKVWFLESPNDNDMEL